MLTKLNGGGTTSNKLLQSNSYGFIGTDPNTLYKFGNGKYKQFEGTEIVAENCVKAKVKDLVVEGKTYQNLCIEDTSNEKSSLNFSNYSMFKTGVYYTIILEITVDNASQINLAFNTSSHVLVAQKGHNKGIYKFKVRNINTDLGEVSSVKLLSLKQEGYTTCLFKNVIVLEGDYTNIDLSNSINGIESVTERENNILSVKINDNTTTLNLPIPLRSLPNGVADTIEGNKLVQRVEKVVLDGSADEAWNNDATQFEGYYSGAFDTIKNIKEYACLISNEFKYNKSNTLKMEYIFPSGVANRGIRIRISNDKATDVSSFREWLSKNPTTVYYELATPIIHDLEVPNISTTKGTNIVTCDNNIKPNLKMKVKVKK